MKSHSLDAFSLAAGAVFTALGALVALDVSASREIDPRWLLAVLLVGLGLAGVLGTLDWSRRGNDPTGGGAGAGDIEDGLDPEASPIPPTPPTSEEETRP